MKQKLMASLAIAFAAACLAGPALADGSYVYGDVGAGADVNRGSGGIAVGYLGAAGTNSRAGTTMNVVGGAAEGFVSGRSGAVDGGSSAQAESYVGRGAVVSQSSASSGGTVVVHDGNGYISTSAAGASSAAFLGRSHH